VAVCFPNHTLVHPNPNFHINRATIGLPFSKNRGRGGLRCIGIPLDTSERVRRRAHSGWWLLGHAFDVAGGRRLKVRDEFSLAVFVALAEARALETGVKARTWRFVVEFFSFFFTSLTQYNNQHEQVSGYMHGLSPCS